LQAQPTGPASPGTEFLKPGTGKKSDDSPSTLADPTQPIGEGHKADPPQLAEAQKVLDKDGESAGAAKSENPERKEVEPKANEAGEVADVDTTVQPDIFLVSHKLETNLFKQTSNNQHKDGGEKATKNNKVITENTIVDNELVISELDDHAATTTHAKPETELHKLETNILRQTSNDQDGGEKVVKNDEVITENTTVDNELVISELDDHATTTTLIAETTTDPSDIVCELRNTFDPPLTDLSDCQTTLQADSTLQPTSSSDMDVVTTDSPNFGLESTALDDALAGLELEGVEFSGRDRKIMLTLMELEGLRGQQVDMREEIQVREELACIWTRLYLHFSGQVNRVGGPLRQEGC
jgi:hypothetical protein